jgi:hypothetical protein
VKNLVECGGVKKEKPLNINELSGFKFYLGGVL